MALPNIMRRLFRNDGYGPLLRTDIVPFVADGDLASSAADAAASTKWVKDLADAEVYVDASVASSGDGFTAATAVKTISEGIAILQSIPISSKEKTRLYISGGTYSENITIRNLRCDFTLLGNIILNGFIYINEHSNVKFIPENNPTTLTINVNSANTPLGIQYYSYTAFDCNVIINTINSTYTAVDAYNSVYITFNGSLTINASSSNYLGIRSGNASWCQVNGNLTINGNPTRAIQAYDAGVARIDGNATLTASTYAIAADNKGMVFIKSSVVSITAGSAMIASSQAFILINNFSTFTYTRTGTGGSFLCQFNSIILIDTATANSKLKLVLGSATTGNVFTSHDCSFFWIKSVKTLEYSGSGSINCNAYSCSILTVDANITITGSFTGKRYESRSLAYIATGNSGANRLPGTTAGTADASTFGLYR